MYKDKEKESVEKQTVNLMGNRKDFYIYTL